MSEWDLSSLHLHKCTSSNFSTRTHLHVMQSTIQQGLSITGLATLLDADNPSMGTPSEKSTLKLSPPFSRTHCFAASVGVLAVWVQLRMESGWWVSHPPLLWLLFESETPRATSTQLPLCAPSCTPPKSAST